MRHGQWLTCVSSYMCFQLIALGEGLPTELAHVGLHPFVYPHVPTEAAGFGEHLPTGGAHWLGFGELLVQLLP